MRKTYYILTILTLILTSCEKEIRTNTGPINSTLIISLEKWYNRPEFQIYTETESEKGSVSDQIVTKSKIKSDCIKIDYKKIDYCETCLAAIGPASNRLDIGVLNNGTIDLLLIIKNHRIKGKIVSTDTDCTLTIDNNDYIKVGTSRITK